MEERDKSDAKILYDLKAKNEQLEKELNWFANMQAHMEMCPTVKYKKCPQNYKEGKEVDLSICVKCWREVASKSV